MGNSQMDMQPVASSAVSEIGYADGKMRIRYKNGGTYEYDVDEATYQRLLASESIGRAVRGLPRGVKIG